MKLRNLKTIFIYIGIFCFTQSLNAQYSSKKIKTKHESYTDSLKNVEYNYVFPIWGQKAYKKGFYCIKALKTLFLGHKKSEGKNQRLFLTLKLNHKIFIEKQLY